MKIDTPTPAEIADYYATRLAFETDVSDAHAAHEAGARVQFVDVRNRASWNLGRISGAIHMHHSEVADRALAELPLDVPVIVYCWGPGCNGGQRGALALARLGYQVKEMIGGYEYWVREGFSTEDDHGVTAHQIDPLTSPPSDSGPTR